MISNIFDKNIINALSYFLISPGSRYTRKEIKEKINMNNVPLDNTLNKLLSLNIIKKKNNVYSLNNESKETLPLFEIIKREYLEFSIPHEIFNIIVETAEKLSKIKFVKSAVLFGSYAKLIHTFKSDIDIAIITVNINKQEIEQVKKEINKISDKIELHFFKEKDMKEKDPLIKDILKNGKRIL